MSRKKKNKRFRHNPFRDLKGLSVSTPSEESENAPETAGEEGKPAFEAEMARLGVRPTGDDSGSEADRAEPRGVEPGDAPEELSTDSETALFLKALDRLDTRFEDGVPVSEPAAVPRRLKQLRQGRLSPEDELDLHGLSRSEAVVRVGYFLDNAVHHGRKTVLIITGRGLGSGGEPVLRREVERYLDGEGRKWVAEWGRAPRRYGGEGALVAFLKSRRNG